MKNKAFTLVELLVCVSIIAIFAAVSWAIVQHASPTTGRLKMQDGTEHRVIRVDNHRSVHRYHLEGGGVTTDGIFYPDK